MNYTRAALLHDIPEVVSPDLLEALAAMGRGDKIVLANLNFPAASTCRGPERPLLVRADGHRTAKLLEAIVKLLPVEKVIQILISSPPRYLALAQSIVPCPRVVASQHCIAIVRYGCSRNRVTMRAVDQMRCTRTLMTLQY